MQLASICAPGRSNRKARAYCAEIQRLRAAGHTLASIRASLATVGICVSLSTVRREAVHKSATAASPHAAREERQEQAPPTVSDRKSDIHPAATRESFHQDPRSGRQIADDFIKGCIVNPLLQQGI